MKEYCGPFVIRIITGQTEERIRRRINRLERRPRDGQVEGMYRRQTLDVLKSFGVRVVKSFVNGESPTLHSLIKEHEKFLDKGECLILIRGHWICICEGYLYDSSHKKGIGLDDPKLPYKRSRVHKAYPCYTSV